MWYMNLKVDKNGFEIKEKRYNIGDVICYSDENIKGIILFGFYDNDLDYDEKECGCGFYIMKCNLVKGKWEPDKRSLEGVSAYFSGEKEDDFAIIKEIRNLFSEFLI